MVKNMDNIAAVGVTDMTAIPQITEYAINNNLKIRYEDDLIYTYAGTILIAVNPYKKLEIFDKETVFKYHGQKFGIFEPHVYAIAEAAYRSIIDDNLNQSCVISGESGAGKTESTKLMVQYLCAVTTNVSTWVQQQILEANTILEAFGNAKTVRNDNSSRFGKFMQICFDCKNSIKGCIIQDYLLEQSRITFQSSGERNYHVLYQLVAQGQTNLSFSEKYLLKEPKIYKYLNATGNIQIDIQCEAKKFEALTMAFTVLQISEEAIEGVLKTLSAILWLGNLDFIDIDGEKCDLSETDKEICSYISTLLGLKLEDIIKVLVIRQINVRGCITEIPLKIQEARENRHSMAKALYSKSFGWLVSKINTCTNPGQDRERFLGVLDIFGFENFSKNSFEQLCINYTNEKLHKFFNNYVFALEQDIYKREEIIYTHVEFTDNALCLELIEKPPRCIFKLLTEQCHMPKGSDSAYLNNLHTEFEFNPYYIKGNDRRHWESEFGIKHYAGNVIYYAEGFVDKNRDVQQDVFFDFMSRSESAFTKELSTYQESQFSPISNSTTLQKGTSKSKCTVTDNFRQQLQSLIDILQNTKPWYVRCIKPNTKKQPNEYDESLVIDQLKYLGMLDIVRIRQEGFPIHLPFQDFVSKYRCLIKKRKQLSYIDEICYILGELNAPKTEWQVGKTKVFLRPKAFEPLVELRKSIINKSAIFIQKQWRAYICYKNYKLVKISVLKIQHAYRGWKLRIQFLRMRRAAVVIQSHLRGVFAREVASALREMRRVDEEMKRRGKRLLDAKDKILNGDETKELEDCERLVQNEMDALSFLAEQINVENNNHHNKSLQNISNDVDASQNNFDSVDLDNLFAFLSESNINSSAKDVIDEISSKMDDLVDDLEQELGNCKQIESVTAKDNCNKSPIFRGVPTLPEPTVPPPPPPKTLQDDENNFLERNKKNSEENFSKPEPIYEAVLNSSAKKVNIVCENEQATIRSSTEKNIDLSKDNKNNFDRNLTFIKNQPAKVPENLTDQVDEKDIRRKNRVEKKLQEMHHITGDVSKDLAQSEAYFDIVEFAENYFNAHERANEGTIISSLTKKGKKLGEIIPKYEMVTFLRTDKIETSHIHMYDPENVVVACNIFREINKYMRGEYGFDRELQAIQYIIGAGISRDEIRDEIFVQCIRQATNNPNMEWLDRIWLLMCLLIVAFQPSKLLFRYYVSFLKKNLDLLDGKLRQYVQWCYDNCKCTKVSARNYPPSSVEIAAMKRLGTIVCRFFFLDGRTKAIDVHPTDTAADAVQKLADKLNLCNTDGWAIFQSRPDGEDHIKSFDYLYDIIADWEAKQLKGAQSTKKNVNSGTAENRFVFKKRLFKNTTELSQDPVEVNMLYAQAVYSVVKCDEFPVSEKVALQLAGLQAQVALGDPSTQPKPEYYANVNCFLPKRISKTREPQFWIPILAQAHRQYGASRNELTAKVLYLSCVMQYPLYGTTMFSVIYKGYWSYPNNIIIGINHEGISFIQPDDKTVVLKFKYSDLESIMLDPSDSFITITLTRNWQQQQSLKHNTKDQTSIFDTQRCFVFETGQKNEIGSLIVSYCPSLSNWISNIYETSKKCKVLTTEDRSRLHQNVVICRRQLVDQEIVKKPQETGGFLRNTLRRLSKHRVEKLRTEQRNLAQDHGETYKGFSHMFWAFTRQQISQSLSKLSDQDESTMLHVFQTILNFSGVGFSNDTIKKAEEEHISIIQTIMEKCMRKDALINELYLQLIKQTTDHPDPNSRVNLKHWSLLCLLCSFILPSQKPIRKYLVAHLKRCGSDYVTEEGKYARFAEQCFFKTQGSRRRQWPPSREEVLCTINRRPCYARFHFMDGQFYSIEFAPSSSASEVLQLIKNKIGLQEKATGYAIYEVLGNSERSLQPEEKICDVISKWEKYRLVSHQNQTTNNGLSTWRSQQHIFLFKKHLFFDGYINLEDPIEKELLYHQMLQTLRSERYPISEMEAIMLTALQGQLELGDFKENLKDYRIVASHCLPPRFVPNIPNEAVAMHHQSLRGMISADAKKSFLNLVQSWPLHRATIFDVMQTFTSNWPRVLWLAVDQNGIHLLEHRSRHVLCTYEYQSILSYSPNSNSLMILTGADKKQSKVILTTSQAFQIATLIKEYSEIIKLRS